MLALPASIVRASGLVLALGLSSFGLACDSGSEDGESSGAGDFDPLEFYGPCDGPRCGKGSGLSIQSGGLEGQTCVCVINCDGATSCPVPDDYAGTPVCLDAGDFGSDRCSLPCEADADCPATTSCVGNECQFVG